MVVTNDAGTAEKIRLLRNHGEEVKYSHPIIGFNSRMDELQAAILRVKLRWLDQWNHQRRQNACLYNELLEDCDIVTPYEAEYGKHVYHLYVIRTGRRDRLRQELSSRAIETGIHYPVPVHLQQAFEMYGYRRGDLPTTERVAREILSLPMYPELTSEQIEYIAEVLNE
jgi:dTDP-4-amino-4,6-dideoxygalactose transaminase